MWSLVYQKINTQIPTKIDSVNVEGDASLKIAADSKHVVAEKRGENGVNNEGIIILDSQGNKTGEINADEIRKYQISMITDI